MTPVPEEPSVPAGRACTAWVWEGLKEALTAMCRRRYLFAELPLSGCGASQGKVGQACIWFFRSYSHTLPTRSVSEIGEGELFPASPLSPQAPRDACPSRGGSHWAAEKGKEPGLGTSIHLTETSPQPHESRAVATSVTDGDPQV